MIVLNAVLRLFYILFLKLILSFLSEEGRSVWDFAISTLKKVMVWRKLFSFCMKMRMLWEDFFLNCFKMNWRPQNRYQFLAYLYNSILVLMLLNTILWICKIPWQFWSRCLFYVIYILGIFAAGKCNVWRKTTEPFSCFIQMGLDMLWFVWKIINSQVVSKYSLLAVPPCGFLFSWLLLKQPVSAASSPAGKLLVNL